MTALIVIQHEAGRAIRSDHTATRATTSGSTTPFLRSHCPSLLPLPGSIADRLTHTLLCAIYRCVQPSRLLDRTSAHNDSAV